MSNHDKSGQKYEQSSYFFSTSSFTLDSLIGLFSSSKQVSKDSFDQSHQTIASCSDKLDDFIEKQIYYPPNIDPQLYDKLNTNHSQLVKYYWKSKLVHESDNSHPQIIISSTNGCGQNKTSFFQIFVFSHGNGADILVMFPYLECLAKNLNINVICYDYIGYGLSKDNDPSEDGCYESLEAVIHYLLEEQQMRPENIYLMG